MKRFFLVLPICACGQLPIETVDNPPLDVLRALPPGVSTNDLRTQGGCYYYETDRGLEALTERKIDGGQLIDAPLCL